MSTHQPTALKISPILLLLLPLLVGAISRASEPAEPEGFTDTVCRFYYPSPSADRRKPHEGQKFIGQIFDLPPYGWVVQTEAEVNAQEYTFRKLFDGNLDKMIGKVNSHVGQKVMRYKVDRTKISLEAEYRNDRIGVIGHFQEILFGEPEHCLPLFLKATHPSRETPDFIQYVQTKYAKKVASQVLVMLMDLKLAPFQTSSNFQELDKFRYEFNVENMIWRQQNTRPDSFANHQ